MRRKRRKSYLYGLLEKMQNSLEIALIAKYLAIREMYEICLYTNGVSPRVPYPLDFPEVR